MPSQIFSHLDLLDNIRSAPVTSEKKLRNTMQPFRHLDLLNNIRSSPVIDEKKLRNTINLIHFTNDSLLVHVSDSRYHEDFLIRCYLDSCTAEEIRCRWPESTTLSKENRRPLHLIVEDGLSLILLPVRVTSFDEQGFSAKIPETGYLVGKRCIRRNACRDINTTLTQNGFLAQGDLIDFSPLAFRIRLTPNPGTSFIWMNMNDSFTICLQKGEKIIFSGTCRCLRQTGNLRGRELVLAPLHQKIQRYRKQKIRTPRLRLTPTPSVHFEHPCLEKLNQRNILDLTFAGFSVEEQADDAVLMPGMVITDLEIRQDGMKGVVCTAQVIYRQESTKGKVRCGLAILDMDFRAYRRLSHIMVHAGHPQTLIPSVMEMDALWEFLFNTGFIYPKKYQLIQSSREAFKSTYSRIYREEQEIEAHMTLQENDRVYAHVAILRAYQRTWMVHHLAARPLSGKHTGLFVLKNIIKYFDGLYRYPSIQIDHMIFYFRPDNYFPNLFFGGFARDLGNPRACSLDLFAYMSHPTDRLGTPLPTGWQLETFENRHLPELERFYRNTSGGLLLDALRLGQKDEGCETVEEAYRRQGLHRQWHAYALVQGQALKAVLIVNRSSPGLNLSELLNSIKVIVTDPANLPWTILTAALDRLATAYDTASVPLLIYPATYPSVKVEKQYLLWILDTQYGKEYGQYMEQKTKLNLGFILKYLFRKLVPK